VTAAQPILASVQVGRDAAVISLDELDHTPDAHDFVGGDHDVPFSVILIHTPAGGGPKVHRHPYPEVFIVDAGEATFRLGDATRHVTAGHVVVGPSMVPHGFTNSGSSELRIVAIHGSPSFMTEWLDGAGGAWISKRRAASTDERGSEGR
ncbi:MAG TPA: cupin domain-containing protein, partial [Candidatus Limnocylindrales bacterium]|nr:cupin domain-containing protein [Candidatus Limnocylindrales bacterium]